VTRPELREAAALLAGGGVVAFTGAGISAESGIPTFRDPGGVWDRFDPEEFGTWEGLARVAETRPHALASFLSELRRTLSLARPGPAHRALVLLEEAGLLDAVVTQNVDGLHQDAGSRRVVELHGSFRRRVCLVCGHRATVDREGFIDDLDRAVSGLRSAFVASLASLLPRCPACGGPAHPDFVAFGDAVQGFEEAERLVRGCRTLLVIGTSGEVLPAARLPEEGQVAGATVVEVSPEPTFINADLRVEGVAGTTLPRLVELAVTMPDTH
jgi:NAD-dependent deacetylase